MRCETHALAAGADGRCVLCLRSARDSGGARDAAAGGANGTVRVFAALGVLFAVVLGGGSIYRFGLLRAADRSLPIIGPTLADTRASSVPPPTTTAASTAPGANANDRANDVALQRQLQEERDAQWRRALASVRIVVYTTSWCPSCKKAKAWLRESAIPFEERDIEASAEYARQMRALHSELIPTIDIEGDVDIGFSEQWVTSARENAARRKLPR
jgi:glutaredoxin 3